VAQLAQLVSKAQPDRLVAPKDLLGSLAKQALAAKLVSKALLVTKAVPA
jgi:hypothetical protein